MSTEPIIPFRCNVCGVINVGVGASTLGREDPSCPSCMSSVRMRGIIHHLSVGLFGRSLALPDFPFRPDVIGIGLSDWSGYAEGLAAKFSYVNTFYHRAPFLDIANPPADRFGTCDFLISTDVFEHVPPPVGRAFSGAFNLLKPGGLLVLTVPFTEVPQTIEHFPDLNLYKIVEIGGEYVLVNRDHAGQFSVRSDLTFHGGPGSTLEMRVFSRSGTIEHLKDAGFVKVTVHGGSAPAWGLIPPHHHGLPITARRAS